jgi:hydrogenase maturation protease
VTGGVLVVGYGSALRSDDGLGWHAAARLAEDPRLAGVTVLQRHQLTPELALDVSRADLVVLVDAAHGPAAGTYSIERVTGVTAGSTTWSHHLDPNGLVALTGELYGRAPAVVLVMVGVASVEMGDRLSPVVEAALPRVVDAVVELIEAEISYRAAVPGRA